MMIKKEDVEHIAKLARLGLTEKEREKMQKELSSILDYIEKLKKVDISKAKISSHLIQVENVMREDEESKKPKVKSQKLLELAPEKKAGYLKVKSITRAFAQQKWRVEKRTKFSLIFNQWIFDSFQSSIINEFSIYFNFQ